MAVTAIIVGASFGAATLSGALGMGGGMILMGALTAVLSVGAAMTLHGAIMFAANGSRAAMLSAHIQWRALPAWAVGAVAAIALFWSFAVVTNPTVVYLSLGLGPLCALALSRWIRLDFARRGHALFCGLAVTSAQLLAGASGPLLDLFFLRSRFDRQQVVATKAFTQTFGHLAKVIYYGALVAADVPPAWLFVTAITAAVLGTRLGKGILLRLRERQFRAATTVLVMAISLLFTLRGLSAFVG